MKKMDLLKLLESVPDQATICFQVHDNCAETDPVEEITTICKLEDASFGKTEQGFDYVLR